MRVLVTGGAGFIGSAVCRLLVREGITVLNIDKLTYASNLASLDAIAGHERYTFSRQDICDGDAMREAFTTFQPDAVMHLAAETHVDRSINDASSFIDSNIVGTYRLLEAARAYCDRLPAKAREAFRFVHVSTDEVFGSLGATGKFREDTPYRPNSPYSASKAASDHLALAWHATYGLPVMVSNCSNNFGPFQFPEKLIPLTILNALEGRSIGVYGDGSNVRDWLYVDDHARGLLTLLTRGKPGETYNFGGDSEYDNLAIVERICAAVDTLRPSGTPRRSLITFVADRPGHDFRYAMDTAKVRGALGWQPLESFERRLDETVRWYLDNSAWWTPLRARYDGKRLGLPPDASRASS